MGSFADLINSDKPVLVDFYADWCGPCKMMAPMLKQLSSEIEGTAKIIKVDIDKNPKAATKYGIQSIPTLIIFKKGQIKWRHTGAASLDQMKQAINSST